MSNVKDIQLTMLEIKCEGGQAQMIEYLKNEIIPQLESGITRGYKAWSKGWVAYTQGGKNE